MLNKVEIATILAALRVYQAQQQTHLLTHFAAIATNDGEFPAMTADEIDGLCEKLNMGEFDKSVCQECNAPLGSMHQFNCGKKGGAGHVMAEDCADDDDDDGLDMDIQPVLVAINTLEGREESQNIGAVIPPDGTSPYELQTLWNEWKQESFTDDKYPQSDTEFVKWLIEEKGWQETDLVKSIFVRTHT